MKIDLTKIEFTEDEMIEILQDNGYRVEKCVDYVDVEVYSTYLASIQCRKERNYAIPIGETFDRELHNTVGETFETLLMSHIKKTIMTAFKIPPQFQ